MAEAHRRRRSGALPSSLARALEGDLYRREMIMRAIPSTGDALPIVGLGSSATFSQVARSEDYSALREVLSALVGNGGAVFDTAPAYGASEEVAGRIANQLGIQNDIFWATKMNVVGGGGVADPAAARAQIATSFERINTDPVNLIQVHGLGDIPTQMGILKEMKQAGRIRYIGLTSTSEGQYGDLADVMRNEPIDFIGVDYAVDDLGGGRGRLPDESELRRMIELVEALPEA